MIASYHKYLSARAAQQKLLESHLRAQYLDRVQYWESRAESRLQTNELVLIQDGMDQGKFACPRHPRLRAKAFEGLAGARPRLHIVGALLHGHCLAFGITEPTVPKDSNTQIELIAHLLTRLQKKHAVNLSQMRVTIQCDNCCRELKNNPVLRWLASNVSSGTIRAARVRNLRSGHSREDIDQIFGSLAQYLVTHGSKAETSAAFEEHIKKFLDTLPRKHEKDRYVVRIDRARDWRLCHNYYFHSWFF